MRTPPPGRKWQPGESGNPNGRPKKALEFVQWIREKAQLPEEREKLWKRAQKSDYLMKHLMEMAYGKPTQAIQLSGEVTHRYLATFDTTDSDLSLAEAEQSRPEVRH